jgi:hypothetical protein
MSGHKSVVPIRACVKVADCYDLSFAGTLTYVKMIQTCVESNFITEHVRSAIAGHFFYFGEDG